MQDAAESGVEYGVEVKYSDHPQARWMLRYGWFPEVPREYEKTTGLERAKLNLAHVRENEAEHYPVSRIVKKVQEVSVIED